MTDHLIWDIMSVYQEQSWSTNKALGNSNIINDPSQCYTMLPIGDAILHDTIYQWESVQSL